MADEIDLEHRIAKLEGDSRKRMVAQYFIYPGLLLLIGWSLNRTIENQKLAVQRIQITQTLLPSLFSENHSQALATEIILSRLEPDMAKDLHQLTADYYEGKLKSAINNGQYELANNIIQAAKSVGGEAAGQIIKSADAPNTVAAINQLEIARSAEKTGFQALIEGDFPKAEQSFEQSESAYHGFHQVYEIGKLLRLHKKDFADPAARQKLIQTITTNYYRGAPPELLNKLKDSKAP